MTKFSRRAFLQRTAATAAATTVLSAPYVRAQGTGGTLAVALSQHWVPAVEEVQRAAVMAWGAANNVEVTIDFYGGVTVPAAESRAYEGHDMIELSMWQFAQYKHALEPVDDVMAALTEKHGAPVDQAEYAMKFGGAWRGVPTTQCHTKSVESRADLWLEHAGIDLKALFPAGPRDQARIDAEWTHETFLAGAKKLHAAGVPFAQPISSASNADANDWLGPLFLSFGAEMVNASGEIVLDSPATRAVLAYLQELTQYMPSDIYSWDDGGNNRWLASGQGAGIVNPPSVWAGALKDAPDIAAQLWHHDMPSGPVGRFRGLLVHGYGIWEFAKNKSAAKDLAFFMADKEQFASFVTASNGYDIPLFPSYNDIPVWNEAGPPAGSLYNYPVRGNEKLVVAGYPAPADIAARIYSEKFLSNLVGRVTQAGEDVDAAIAWGVTELEGYLRG